MDAKTLCLGVLTLGDMTGYEIKRHFEQAFSHFFVAGYGSIYPALGALTRDGLVTCVDVVQEKRPDKKVYSLTEAGRAAFQESLLSTPPRHKVRSEFMLLLYFSDLLPAGHLQGVIAQRAADIETLLGVVDAYEQCDCPRPGDALLIGFSRATLEAQLEFLRQILDTHDAEPAPHAEAPEP